MPLVEDDTPVEEEGLVTPAVASLLSGVELGPELAVWSSSVGDVRSCKSFLWHFVSGTRLLVSPTPRLASLLA